VLTSTADIREQAGIMAASHRSRSGDRQVGLMNLPIMLSDRVFPRVFDRIAAPLMKAVGFTANPIESTTGNVFDPRGVSEHVGAGAVAHEQRHDHP
jgi:hypothetical protein